MPLYDDGDRLIGTLGVSRDITEQKRTDSQLQATTERLALASGSAGIGSWEFDVANQRLTWDDRMYLLYGVPRTGQTEPLSVWLDSLHPDDLARCERELAAAIRGETEFQSEFRVVRSNGEIVYLKAASRALRGPDGKALRLSGVNIDMSEHRRAELQLRETSSQLSIVLDSVSKVAIIATDAQLTINLFNAGAELLLGYTSEELVGHATPIVLHDPVEVHARSPSFGPALVGWEAVVQPALLKKPYEWTYLRKDGGRITVSQTVAPMHSNQGELLGYVSVARDVTSDRQYEESLRETTRRAEQASRAKGRFLANMSHEIRTPLNAVIGLSYLLEQTALNEQQSTFLKKINVASRTLLALINDVLDLSKIEAGELIVDEAPFSLPELLKQLADDMAVHAAAKSISFRLEVPDNLPERLRGDAKRLNQILTNLASNAVRFTDRGRVTVRAMVVDRSSQSVKLCFVVHDTGIGISPLAQARLFAPFSQADTSITRRFGGTGLGLSIVKSLVDLMGGKVSLKSTPGVGSEFEVTVDFDLAGEAAQIEEEPAPSDSERRLLDGVRVLVVDDSEVNLDVTKRILELEGALVSVAINGLEGVERIQAHPHDFEIVLMDVQMPVLDGYAATGRIRRELGLVDLPVIALTAGALSSERQSALSAGMDDFVVKPFDAPRLIRSILRHVRVANQRAATPINASQQAVAQASSHWPQVEGIDASLARSRLINDVGLLRSGLKRLLREFSGITIPEPSNASITPAEYAARLHKLKGIAGTLGAREIQRLATEAEAACMGGELPRAGQLADGIRAQLELLRQSAAPFLETARLDPDAVTAASPAELAPRTLSDFIAMLRHQDLSATDRFVALSPQLLGKLGPDCFEQVRDLIENLEFNEAVKVLDSKRS
jgi:signal transduction histidine kinase/DNA-binding NarL/FixJ family response regulator